MMPTPKQFLALIVGLVLWAILDHVSNIHLHQAWLAFEFSVPLCIGLAIGLLNEQESFTSIGILSFLLAAINLTYQAINPDFDPWTPYDAFLLSGFAFTCFIAAFVVTLSLRIVTLQRELAKASTSAFIAPGVAVEKPISSISLDRINTELPKVVTLLGLLSAIVGGVATLLASIHSVGK